MQIIQNLDGNVAVFNVAGPHRTGKSFILNMILNRKGGFTVGSTQESCTRGIWMWDSPIKHKNKHGEFNLIFLDTEGLGSIDKSGEDDNKIFVLSFLLSSYFVLNTKNVIDRGAIQQLAIMADLSKFIDSNIGENLEPNLAVSSPDFVWVLRDFFLNLNGKKPKEYLQDCLEIEKVGIRNAEAVKEVNFIRDSIRKSFKSIDCFCLPVPVSNGLNGLNFEETLQNLEVINFKDLREDFQTGIKELSDTMKRNICPKSLLTVPLSACAFSKYIEVVVDQLNKNERVSLVDSLELSIKYASEKALKDAIEYYELQMQTFLKQNPMPLSWNILDAKNQEIMDSCYKIVEKHLNGSSDFNRPVLESFQEKICEYEEYGNNFKLTGGLFFKLRSENSIKIKAYNKNVLNNLWKTDIAMTFFNEVQDLNMGQNFINSYEKLQNKYSQNSFQNIEPEMSESFNEWFKENDIANAINNMKFLSEQVKANLEKKQQILDERADRERVEKDLENTINLLTENNKNLNEKIRSMEILHANQIKDLEDKLKHLGIHDVQQPATKTLNQYITKVKLIAVKIITPLFVKFKYHKHNVFDKKENELKK